MGKRPPAGRRFEKGKSGNPGGRPSTKGFRDWLGEAVGKDGSTRRDNLRLALYLKAVNARDKDQMRALEMIYSYDLGKPVQAVELTDGDGQPIDTGASAAVKLVHRIDKMTTGNLRRELEALRQQRDDMTKRPIPPVPPAEPALEPAASGQTDGDGSGRAES
jgi:hypothetical protein